MTLNTNEKPAVYYDDAYATDPLTGVAYRQSPYYPLFKKVTNYLVQAQARSVLEVGCGPGMLAELVMDTTSIQYGGFDFSPVAVKLAGERTGQPDRFFVGDATNSASYISPFDAIVCCEVLEHIDRDLNVIERWPAGTYCVCTVPNFDYESHVRFFHNEAEVCARYGTLIDIEAISRVAKPPMRGMSARTYLRSLRWARDNSRRFLGLLGINRFDYLAGWFVFVGRRRPVRMTAASSGTNDNKTREHEFALCLPAELP